MMMVMTKMVMMMMMNVMILIKHLLIMPILS